MTEQYPARVWETTGKYIDKDGNRCKYDELEAVSLWSSHPLTDDDMTRRRESTAEQEERRENKILLVEFKHPIPLRRKG